MFEETLDRQINFHELIEDEIEAHIDRQLEEIRADVEEEERED